MNSRVNDWLVFSEKVRKHIEGYTVPQYGDKGEDLATGYSVQSCLDQADKYRARHGRNQRQNQDLLDLVKHVHYIQMAYDKLISS